MTSQQPISDRDQRMFASGYQEALRDLRDQLNWGGGIAVAAWITANLRGEPIAEPTADSVDACGAQYVTRGVDPSATECELTSGHAGPHRGTDPLGGDGHVEWSGGGSCAGDPLPYRDVRHVSQPTGRELSFDEAEALGLDGTGRDGHRDFPYRTDSPAVIGAQPPTSAERTHFGSVGSVAFCGATDGDRTTDMRGVDCDECAEGHADTERGSDQ